MTKKNVDLLDPKAVSDFAKFIDTLANKALGEYWHRSSLKGRDQESDSTAVKRLLTHIFEEGGGDKLKGELHEHLEKLILKRLIEIQSGKHK